MLNLAIIDMNGEMSVVTHHGDNIHELLLHPAIYDNRLRPHYLQGFLSDAVYTPSQRLEPADQGLVIMDIANLWIWATTKTPLWCLPGEVLTLTTIIEPLFEQGRIHLVEYRDRPISHHGISSSATWAVYDSDPQPGSYRHLLDHYNACHRDTEFQIKVNTKPIRIYNHDYPITSRALQLTMLRELTDLGLALTIDDIANWMKP